MAKRTAAKKVVVGAKAPQVGTQPGNPRVRFVAVPTTPLVQIETDGVSEVDGAIVKVCPVLRASERVSFDGAGLAKSLRDRGAKAVLLAPRVLPETAKEAEERPPAQTTRQAVEDWFGRLKGASEEDAAAAKELVLRAVEEDERANPGGLT